MPEENLVVKDYTDAVAPLIDNLREKYTGETLYLSDVRDSLGRQAVDLVQEGGGVHGIALAGYTYVLESMGITFDKMAGTSAGAINTLLLASTLSEPEYQLMTQVQSTGQVYPHYKLPLNGKYYPTRSEKLLDYLTNKDLSDLVDGHPKWKRLLLRIFAGGQKTSFIRGEKNRWKWAGIVMGISLVVMLITSLIVLVGKYYSGPLPGLAIVTIIVFMICLMFFLLRLYQGRMLWKLSQHLGINSGNNFKNWVETKVRENNVDTIASLREKLEMETVCFSSHYVPEPLNSAQSPAEKYNIDITKEEQEEFESAYLELEQKIEVQEQMVNQGKANSKAIDGLWDELIRVATNLPVGDPIADTLAQYRAERLLPLFSRALYMMDISCNYVTPKMNIGPYTRELTIITTDISNEIKVEFPAMHKMYWGNKFDMSPAVYVRASMAVPFFFTPFAVPYDKTKRQVMDHAWQQFMKVIKRYQPDDESTLFVDGGAVSNFPINIYATPEMPIPRKPTLGIKLEFEEEDLTKRINSELGEVGSIVSTMRYFYDRDFISKNDMYKRTVRAIDTGQIHWLNFRMTEPEKLELFYRGALAATLFLASAHPQFDSMGSEWQSNILAMSTSVKCGKYPPLEITSALKKPFRNDDLENEDIHFHWHEYKRDRLLALSRQKNQRNLLKTFPKED